MCELCKDKKQVAQENVSGPEDPSRREFIATGARIAAGLTLPPAFGAGLAFGATKAQAKENAMKESIVHA